MTDRPDARPSHSAALARLAGFVLHHRRVVIVLWLVALVAGGAAAGQVSKRFTFDFSLPGQPGYETALRVTAHYGNGGGQPPAIEVVTVPPGQTVAGDAAPIAAAFQRARVSDHRVRIVDLAVTGDRQFVTADGGSTYALLFTPIVHGFGGDQVAERATRTIRAALPAGYRLGTTGLSALESGGSTKGPGVLVETMFGAAGALAVLLFVFASFLALLPLLIAAVSILTTLLVILGLTYITQVSFVVQFLVALVGLGVAIDYSLLLVTRWREERAHGADNATAVTTAVATAGRAVMLSGVTVAIGLVALVVLPVPALRSVGIGGMLIPLVSVGVTLTLLPALLGGIGPRFDWPRVRKENQASRAWAAWARGVVRHRWLAAGVGVAALAVVTAPIFSLTVGETSASALARTGPAHDSYDQLLAGGVPSGVLTPIEVLVRTRSAPEVRDRLAGLPGIATVALASGRTGSRGGLTDLIAIPSAETVNSASLAPVRTVRASLAGDPAVIGVTGVGAIELDYSHAVFGQFPLMFAIIALATFLLLARAFRSIVLAAKAVLLNLVSLGATFGLLTWFWQEGHGSQALFGIPATGAITFWLPLMIFAFLFGLSMDYEVFILTRVREEYDRTGSTTSAIVEGLGRTGRLVTSAALILFLAFASLASAPNTDIKVLATGLGAGILLDATIVRALLVPALVSLLGRWNWWFPRRAARALRLPEPVDAREPAPVG
ncbi:MAG TPA: MMPL family transporter [Mycobacteriales bacterium]|nr:MMPL family transporter [Mycobacteriales bacterium]